MMNLADMVRTQRIAKGLSQVNLAAQTDLSQRTISEIETGARKRPTLRVLSQLARVLETPLDEFVMAAGFAESQERARAMAEEVEAGADPALEAVLLDWRDLDDGAREIVRGIVRSIRLNQEAIEKRFKEAGG